MKEMDIHYADILLHEERIPKRESFSVIQMFQKVIINN